jgi:hypothetical protein
VAGMPGIPAAVAACTAVVAIGRGVAVGVIIGLAVGDIVGLGVGVAITGVGDIVGGGVAPGGLPESPTPDADAVATVARTPPMTSEAATNSNFSLRMIYPLDEPETASPASGDRPRGPRQTIDSGQASDGG